MANDKDNEAISSHLYEEAETFDYYSCEEAVKRLNDYLDHELNADERADVVKHLKICKPCLERFNFEQSLVITIKTKVKNLCAPPELKSRLSSLLHRP
ncbi:MAG: zf-HC2 domain-containing protein [Capsulimonadaceae bacterium]|nr:zf-HC2 domain-containing protein [Capsulimonadaceae bacterium]